MSNPAQHTKWHKFVEVTERIANLPDIPIDDEAAGFLHFWQKDARSNIDAFREDVPVFIYTPQTTDAGNVFECPGEIFSVPSELTPAPFKRFVVESRSSGDSIFAVVDSESKGMKITVFLLDRFGDFTAIIGTSIGTPRWNSEIVEFQTYTVMPEEYCCNATGCALNMVRTVFLQSMTKGMVQDRIEAPERLNRQRARKGKSPIPTVIRMRPGFYYNQEGEQCEYDERKPVRIHWRRGHVRHVWCGVGDERRREPRYISPCLVNYDGGATPDYKTYTTH